MSEERDPQTYAIIGAAMEVHKVLGHGFLELVYQEAFGVELDGLGIPHEREVWLPIGYKGRQLNCTYRADFICYGEVLIELKAIGRITHIEIAQLLNYLKATGLKRGLVLNFGATSLEFERVVL